MAAQKIEFVTVEGMVGKIEHNKGDFKNAQGELVEYDYTEVKLQNEDLDISVVRFPENDNGAVRLPARGDVVRYLCQARAAQSNVKLVVVAQSPYTYAELLSAVQVPAHSA